MASLGGWPGTFSRRSALAPVPLIDHARPPPNQVVECALSGGHLAGKELTRTAGLSKDESHGQTPLP